MDECVQFARPVQCDGALLASHANVVQSIIVPLP
jgi:hypothetical protein